MYKTRQRDDLFRFRCFLCVFANCLSALFNVHLLRFNTML